MYVCLSKAFISAGICGAGFQRIVQYVQPTTGGLGKPRIECGFSLGSFYGYDQTPEPFGKRERNRRIIIIIITELLIIQLR